MQSKLNPYLSFKDSAREAMEFYKSVFGGKLTVNTFKDFGASQNPSEDNMVMHSVLECENGIAFMGADTPSSMQHRPGASISMALSGDNEAELSGYFEKLSVGGKPGVPLAKAPWGDTFGMFTDKFGIEWLVNILGKKS